MSSTVRCSRRILGGATVVFATVVFAACAVDDPASQLPVSGSEAPGGTDTTVSAGSVDVNDDVDTAVDEELESLDADLDELDAVVAELSGTETP